MDIVTIGVGGMFTMMYVGISMMILHNLQTFASLSSSLIYVLTPFVLGSVATSGYLIKRNKDYEQVFNNLNSELGKNALSDKTKDAYEEEQDIEFEIELTIQKITNIKVELQEQKRIMETLPTDSSKEEKTIHTTLSNKNVYSDNFLNTSTVNPDQEETKGRSLVLKRSNNN